MGATAIRMNHLRFKAFNAFKSLQELALSMLYFIEPKKLRNLVCSLSEFEHHPSEWTTKPVELRGVWSSLIYHWKTSLIEVLFCCVLSYILYIHEYVFFHSRWQVSYSYRHLYFAVICIGTERYTEYIEVMSIIDDVDKIYIYNHF